MDDEQPSEPKSVWDIIVHYATRFQCRLFVGPTKRADKRAHDMIFVFSGAAVLTGLFGVAIGLIFGGVPPGGMIGMLGVMAFAGHMFLHEISRRRKDRGNS